MLVKCFLLCGVGRSRFFFGLYYWFVVLSILSGVEYVIFILDLDYFKSFSFFLSVCLFFRDESVADFYLSSEYQ